MVGEVRPHLLHEARDPGDPWDLLGHLRSGCKEPGHPMILTKGGQVPMADPRI